MLETREEGECFFDMSFLLRGEAFWHKQKLGNCHLLLEKKAGM
jgi:hypothetical protein